MEITCRITGLETEACVKKVRTALLSISEIESVLIRLNYPEIVIRLKNNLSINVMNEVLKKEGNYLLSDEYLRTNLQEKTNL
ncbi:hypothetical protein BH10BAC5_BH10BAC5_23480 [soil metagenome]